MDGFNQIVTKSIHSIDSIKKAIQDPNDASQNIVHLEVFTVPDIFINTIYLYIIPLVSFFIFMRVRFILNYFSEANRVWFKAKRNKQTNRSCFIGRFNIFTWNTWPKDATSTQECILRWWWWRRNRYSKRGRGWKSIWLDNIHFDTHSSMLFWWEIFIQKTSNTPICSSTVSSTRWYGKRLILRVVPQPKIVMEP